MSTPAEVIVVDKIQTRFGAQVVHDHVSFTVRRGSLTALIGASGSGKSVLLREIIGLLRPSSGSVRMLDTDVWQASQGELAMLRRRFGMMFQDGALFSALSVAETVAVPLVEHANVPAHLLAPLVRLRLALAGLPEDADAKMPGALSGGMRKRAAIARAIALEPEILFLDEPTSGLDSTTARGIDALLRSLVDHLGITVLLVTHDLDTLLGVADTVIVLAGGKVIVNGDLRTVLAADDPWLQSYFAVRRTVPARPPAVGTGERDGI